MKKKKLDIFNLFYSGAAVVILIGVIAKLLEWPAQDILITAGLTIEAIVFGVSAIKYVEVDEKQEVATEATLSIVADGLGNLVGTASVGGFTGAADTYINIQTGAAEAAIQQSNTSLPTQLNSTSLPGVKNVAVDINNNGSVNNPAHSLWQLEQMDILSLAKDLFFQPEWDGCMSSKKVDSLVVEGFVV